MNILKWLLFGSITCTSLLCIKIHRIPSDLARGRGDYMATVSAALPVVLAPDPNQPQRGLLRVSGSDPCWGWFGSGTETTLLGAC